MSNHHELLIACRGPSLDRWSNICCSSLSICSWRWISSVAPIGPSSGGEEASKRPNVRLVTRANQSGIASQLWIFKMFHLYRSPAAWSKSMSVTPRASWKRPGKNPARTSKFLLCYKMLKLPSGRRYCTLAVRLNMSASSPLLVFQEYAFESFSGCRKSMEQRVGKSAHTFEKNTIIKIKMYYIVI